MDTTLEDGRRIAARVETDYPAEGLVRITPLVDSDDPWTLSIRVPHWATGAQVTVAIEGGTSTTTVESGYTSVRRAFRRGDRVELLLPMQPRVVHAGHRVDAVRGCVAVERGPEVLCLESVDLAAATAGLVDDVAQVRVEPRRVLESAGRVTVGLVALSTPSRPSVWPYGEQVREVESDQVVDVPLLPYHDWAERGPSTMRVWLPVRTAAEGTW